MPKGARLAQLGLEIETIRARLSFLNEPIERRILLAEMRELLEKADAILKQYHQELAKGQILHGDKCGMTYDDYVRAELEELLRELADAQRRVGAARLRLAFLEDFPVEMKCPDCGSPAVAPLSRLKFSKSFAFPCGHAFGLEKFARDIEIASKARKQMKRDLEIYE